MGCESIVVRASEGACLQRAADALTRVSHEVLQRGLMGLVHDDLDAEWPCEPSRKEASAQGALAARAH
jgi:hypothetical protein